MTEQLNELGFYVLAGAPKSPADLIDEVAAGESLALGSAFISERFNIKEAATLSGAVGAVSRTLGVATADRKSTRLNSSHPSISYAVFCLKKKINCFQPFFRHNYHPTDLV